MTDIALPLTGVFMTNKLILGCRFGIILHLATFAVWSSLTNNHIWYITLQISNSIDNVKLTKILPVVV